MSKESKTKKAKLQLVESGAPSVLDLPPGPEEDPSESAGPKKIKTVSETILVA